MNEKGEVYKTYKYIIFKIPKTYKLDNNKISKIVFRKEKKYDLFYNYVEKQDYIELWFVSDNRFSFILNELEYLKIFKIKEYKYLKDNEYYLFDYYGDGKFIHNAYNIFVRIFEKIIVLLHNYIFFLFYKINTIDNDFSQTTINNFIKVDDYIIRKDKIKKINYLLKKYKIISLNDYEYIKKEKEGKYIIHIIKKKDGFVKYKIYENKMIFEKIIKTHYTIDFYY